MDAKPASVLMVDDDRATCQLVRRILSKSSGDLQCDLETTSTLSGALERLSKKRYDNVLLDLGLPDSSGIETIDRVRDISPGVPIVVLTALGDVNIKLEAIRHGAEDLLVKGNEAWRVLVHHISYSIEHKKIVEELRMRCDYYEGIVRKAPDAIVCVGHGGEVVEVNAKGELLFARSREEIVGSMFSELLARDGEREELMEALEGALQGLVTQTTVRSHRRENGGKKLVWDLSRVEDNDKGWVIVAIAHEAQGGGGENDYLATADRLGRRGLSYGAQVEAPKVLVVQEDWFNQMVISSILSDFGLLVEPLQCNQESLESISDNGFDLILVDVDPMNFKQFSLARQLKNRCPGTPVVAVIDSGRERGDIEVEKYFDGCIEKPISRGELYRHLSQHIDMSGVSPRVSLPFYGRRKPMHGAGMWRGAAAASGNLELQEMLAAAMTNIEGLMDRITEFSGQTDPEYLRELAHYLQSRESEDMTVAPENAAVVSNLVLNMIASQQIECIRKSISQFNQLTAS